MSDARDRVAEYLRRNLDEHWTDADANASVLCDEIEPLDWGCRATAVDWFFWQLGTAMLAEETAEAVIDRNLAVLSDNAPLAAYVDVAQHTLAAVLMRLDETPIHVSDAYQAVMFALSPLAVHRMAFDDWMVTADLDELASAFRDLPGHCFLCMAATRDDTAPAMLARDGFWRTMLGRSTGF